MISTTTHNRVVKYLSPTERVLRECIYRVRSRYCPVDVADQHHPSDAQPRCSQGLDLSKNGPKGSPWVILDGARRDKYKDTGVGYVL